MRCNFTPYEGEERYIFVSYSHEDREKVIPIMEYIAKRGYRLWYDEGLTPSSKWTEDIEQHIKNCHIFLAFISANAQESENCQDEIVFAKNNKKILMIVRLEDVELRKGLGLQLSRKQITDGFKHPKIRCMETLFEKYGNIEDGEKLTQYYNRLADFPRVKLRQRRQLVKFGITVSNKLYNRTQDDKYKNSIQWFEERNHPLKFLAT